MNPDPLYMLMKNMTQRAHGPRPYDGILGASQEKVVAYEGEGAGSKEQAISDVLDWVWDNYNEGEVGTLIEIRVIGTAEKDARSSTFMESTSEADRLRENRGCRCVSSGTCGECLFS